MQKLCDIAGIACSWDPKIVHVGVKLGTIVSRAVSFLPLEPNALDSFRNVLSRLDATKREMTHVLKHDTMREMTTEKEACNEA